MVKMLGSTGVVDEAGEEGKDESISSPVSQAKQFTLNLIHSYQKATERFSI